MLKFLNLKRLTALLLFMGVQSAAFAAGPPKPSSMSNPVVLTLVFIMGILLLAIILLGNILIGATQYKYEVKKKAKEAGKITGTAAAVLFLLLPFNLMAQEGEEATTVLSKFFLEGVSPLAFYVMLGVILVELLIIFLLLFQLKMVIKTTNQLEEEKTTEEVAVRKSATAKIKLKEIWNKLNNFRSQEQEADILLEHDYDGIKELDNKLPPWWLYGFYISIVASVIYLWVYHVAESAPLSAEEFQIAWEKGEREVEEYLKNSAANVDENTVTLITDEAALKSAQALFVQNCQACHGAQGEGNAVGPNLTDEYWLHGGSLSDIFKSIKYGWPDKGMKSWKDDFSPVQIAQLTSYIKSIQGLEHPNAKEPQGELYIESSEEEISDSDQIAGRSQ